MVAAGRAQGPGYHAFPASPAQQAYRLGAGRASRLPGTPACENEAQHGERMHYCFYFVFPFISCPHARTISVSIYEHSCTHTQPSFLLPSCVTPRCTLAHTVLRTPGVDAVVSLLHVARPPFATNPCPFHTKLPVGKTHNFYTTRS